MEKFSGSNQEGNFKWTEHEADAQFENTSLHYLELYIRQEVLVQINWVNKKVPESWNIY